MPKLLPENSVLINKDTKILMNIEHYKLKKKNCQHHMQKKLHHLKLHLFIVHLFICLLTIWIFGNIFLKYKNTEEYTSQKSIKVYY